MVAGAMEMAKSMVAEAMKEVEDVASTSVVVAALGLLVATSSGEVVAMDAGVVAAVAATSIA